MDFLLTLRSATQGNAPAPTLYDTQNAGRDEPGGREAGLARPACARM